MFQLTPEEVASLRWQMATSNKGRAGRRYAPYVFTEQGDCKPVSQANSPAGESYIRLFWPETSISCRT
jgi:hypothetical protein